MQADMLMLSEALGSYAILDQCPSKTVEISNLFSTTPAFGSLLAKCMIFAEFLQVILHGFANSLRVFPTL